MKGIRNALIRLLFYIFSIIPIDKRKVVFCNFYGKGFGCNPKYIALALRGKNLKLIWLSREIDNNIPSDIKQVKYKSIKAIYELSTAKVWIDNFRKPIYTHKRKNQFYLQTGHGTMVLKRIEKDVEKSLTKEYIKAAKHDSSMIDLTIVNSNFMKKLRTSSFWYDGAVSITGSPRVDPLLLNADKMKKTVLKHLGIPQNTYLVLYAPTFRRGFNTDPYKFDMRKLADIIENKYNKKCFILYRFHPTMIGKIKTLDPLLTSDNDFVMDVTKYYDMQELLGASDTLITDYSGTMFEFMYMKKPCYLYATDIEEYKKDRNFYFKFDELPFPLSTNQDELFSNIKTFDYNIYSNKCMEFAEKYGIREDGKATERVIKILFDKVWNT